jgi:putative ABC transport system permease protein
MRPPRTAAWLLKRIVPGEHGTDLLDDLTDAAHRRLRTGWSDARVTTWFWIQVLSPGTWRLGRAVRKRGRREGTMMRWVGTGVYMRQLVRGLRRAPGFTFTVTLTLALGIGANSAVFSVVNAVLLRPLPYPEADRLVYVGAAVRGDPETLLSGPEWADLVAEADVLTDVAGIFGDGTGSLTTGGRPEAVTYRVVSPPYFDVYGVPPLIGRTFVSEDDFKLSIEQIRDPDLLWPSGAIVLSYGLWQRAFGGDPSVLGRSVTLTGRPKHVVGVMPPGFRGRLPAYEDGHPEGEDLWQLNPWVQSSFPRDTRFVRVLARLRVGASMADVQEALDAFAGRQRDAHVEESRDDLELWARPLHGEVVVAARTPLYLLLGAVGFVLLIACANVATLFLARGNERVRELSLRRALGAGDGHVVAIALGEALILAGLGAVSGLLAAGPISQLLVSMAPAVIPGSEGVGVDRVVLIFTGSVAVTVALASGLVPALRARSVAAAGLGASTRTSASRGQRWVGSTLAVAEVALALVLLSGTGLMLRSLANVLSVDPGFEVDGLVSASVSFESQDYPTWASRVTLYRQIQDALHGLPGVTEVGGLTPLPFQSPDGVAVALLDGAERRTLDAQMRRAMPGAVEALGVEVVQGRPLTWADMRDFDALKAVVDERFAARAFPGGHAVGGTIGIERREYGSGADVYDELKRVEIVGVVSPIRSRDLRVEDRPSVYVTHSQNMFAPPSFVVRTASPEAVSRVRGALAEVDPDLLTHDLGWLEERASDRTATLSFALRLIGLFAIIGTVMAVTGVYGLLSHSVGQREGELLIRAALGADRRSLVQLVLRSAFGIAGAGIVIGLLGTWGVTRLLRSFLFEVGPNDPPTLLTVSVLLALVVVVASWRPGVRAGRADPASALHAQ